MKNSSSALPGIPPQFSQIILRVVLGIIFVTHGAARFYYASIPNFGEFLNSQGFLIGEFIAWTITIGEIIGGLLLIAGILVKYVVIFHFIIVFTGIFLVHFPNGWFVVGHGQNGIEYSILILVVLLFLYSQPTRKLFSIRDK